MITTDATYKYHSLNGDIDSRIAISETPVPPTVLDLLNSRGWVMSGQLNSVGRWTKDSRFFELRWGEALAVENMLMFLELEA